MAVYELSNCCQMDLEEEDSFGSEDGYSSEDLENDPDYNIVEETLGRFSNLSVEKKSETRFVSDPIDSDPKEIVVPERDESDEKSFELVQKIIGDGQLEKLKVQQCKVYLRKNGLRLTGNKETLIQRIKEHFEILNGGGEKKYPPSSFVLNCKGDVCTGDVVMFEQNVYEMFNLASRSASGPPCGTRIVAGRIVKESYGAAKQQHTFTIEVLWSKGEKPLPPLHPLLIKGRNLYRLKTVRQRWDDEGKRHEVLMEKHQRGSLARSDREARIEQKEKKKRLKADRMSRKESTKNQSNCNLTLAPKSSSQPQQSGLSVNSGKPDFHTERSSGAYANSNVPAEKVVKPINQASEEMVEYRTLPDRERIYTEIQDVKHMSKDPLAGSRPRFHLDNNHGPVNTFLSMNGTAGFPLSHRQPLTAMKGFHPIRQHGMQQQLCRYYAKGRCYYGDNCKFSHGTRE